MFGKYKESTDLFELNRIEENLWLYRSENKEVKIVDEEPILEIIPSEPLNVPERITKYFLVEIPELIIAPRTRIVKLVKVPAEIVILYKNTIIDAFSKDKPRYALYGPPDEGIVVRYLKGEFISDEEAKGEKGFMYIPLRIKNYTNNVNKVHYFVIDSSYLDLYYKKRSWFATTEFMKLDIKVDGRFMRYTNKPYNKFKNLEHLESGRRKILTKEMFEMRWELQ